jgi:hypothetical protein
MAGHRLKLNKTEMLLRFFYGAFALAAVYCLGRYFHYIVQVVAFSYDWEATDGDHLNFAHRIAQGLPIYLSLEAGKVLSIYNPLYHAFVALVGGADAGMSLARGVSFLFWLLCPLAIFFYYAKKWGLFLSAIAAVFVWLPSEPGLLLDIVQVSPNSTMAFMFLATLLLAEYCVEKKDDSWRVWVLLGVFAALCFLAKQQGIIAIGSVMAFLLVRRIPVWKMAAVMAGFAVMFGLAYAYLEWVNSGQYLRATISDLKIIMSHDPELAESRLYGFVIQNNAVFALAALLSIAAMALRVTKLSIWHVSFVLHLIFLLKVLGNAGGGPNYFLTMWITMVLVGVGLVASLTKAPTEISSPYFHLSANSQVRIEGLTKLLLIGLFVSISIGTISIHRQLNASVIPSPELEKLMEEHYQAVGKLVQERPNAKILTNRNIGALVAHGANVENEGSTMFQYAWAHGEIFQPSVVITAVREKQYDLIVTGIQPYPRIISDAIAANYKVALLQPEILSLGNVGLSTIYIPK